MELSSFQNNPKNLDPSYKMDLDLWIVRKGKTCITVKFHRTDLVIYNPSREGNTPSYSQIITELASSLYLCCLQIQLRHFKGKNHRIYKLKIAQMHNLQADLFA